MGPRPRHVTSQGSKTCSTIWRATGLPSSLTPRRYALRISGSPLSIISTSDAMPSRMSTGSNPVTTPGMPKSSTRKRYGLMPVMVETWPGRMKPSMRVCGSLAIAHSAGGVVLWTLRTEKFCRSRACASRIAAAMVGVVVSNPTPMKMTGRPGFSRAMVRASRGEYTMRTSCPAAFSAARELVDPGTRIMSPNVVMMTPSTRASAMARSMSWLAVTHTGQPGPESRCRFAGMIERKP